VGLAGSILLAAVWVVVPRLASWSLALPVLLISRVSPWGALQTSQALVGKYRWSIAGGWLAWFLFHATLSSLFSSFVYGAARLTIASTTQWLPVLVPVLGFFLFLWLVGGLFLSLYQGISFALIVSSLYRRFGWQGEHGAKLRQERGENWVGDYFKRRLGAERADKPEPAQPLRLDEPADRLDQKSRRWLWLSAGLGAIAIGAGLWLLLSLNSTEDAVVLAHRGAAGLRPENTLAAFDKACEDKTDFVELDVQESADGEVIVFHDSDYMKIAGVKLKAWDATLPELAKIDIGSSFSPEYQDQRTPLLRDALRLCKGRAKVDIELKYYGHNTRLVEKVIEIVEQEGMVDQIMLMSLYHPFVVEAKQLRPTWTVGLLAAVAVGDVTQRSSDFVALNTQSTTRWTIDQAHRRGKSVYVWTVDNPVLMSYYLGLGVDGLITNRPDVAREVIEQLKEMSPAERLLLDGSVRLGIVPAENKADISENGA
jgi:glycerophosphoryl diester phosphodiesterase